MPSSDIAIDDSIRKAPVETSKELSRRYDLDGVDDEGADDSYHGQFTRNDRRDMGRMGKVQELRVSGVDGCIRIATPLNVHQRNFRSFSALSFTVVLQGTWEVLLVQVPQLEVSLWARGLIT